MFDSVLLYVKYKSYISIRECQKTFKIQTPLESQIQVQPVDVLR